MEAASVGEAPLQDAVYVGGAVNKIFGVSGVYVLQFNAVTGQREAQVRISSPVNATCRLVYHAATGLLYASVWNEPNLQNLALAHPNKDIYPINPATMAVGARLNLASVPQLIDEFNGSGGSYFGPRWIGSAGNYLYVQWAASTEFYQMLRVNPTNLADRCTNVRQNFLQFQTEQATLTPTQIFVPDPDNLAIQFAITGWNVNGDWDLCDVPPYNIIACEYSDFDGLVYAVDGFGSLLRINNPATDNFTPFNLTGTITPAPASMLPIADACRLRYSYIDSLIYLPCMSRNSVLIFNQTTNQSLEVTGFTNPVDVVFTDSRAFAVQNSPAESLKEIT